VWGGTSLPPHRQEVTRRILAIDGPAASGKGTMARRLAAHLGWPHLDTGLLYRAVGLRVLDTGDDPEAAARAISAVDLARDDLRGQAAGQAASAVAAIPGVRAALLEFQRGFGAPGDAVLDGRDIGTVIFPAAWLKLYVTASVAERARRRARELGIDPEAVEAEIIARDARDTGRAVAPMRPAPDAILLETTTLDADAAFAAALSRVLPRLSA